MAKLCVALGLCAAAAFFSLSQFATRRGRQGDDVKALCRWLTSSTVPDRVRQWALTSPLLNCAGLLSQRQGVSSMHPADKSSQEERYEKVFPATTEFPAEPWSLSYEEVASTWLQEGPEQEMAKVNSVDTPSQRTRYETVVPTTTEFPSEPWALSYEELTSTRLQEIPEEERTTVFSSTPTDTALENEQTTHTEPSTQSSTSHSDDLTSTHAILVPSHIEEYQTGWSEKATHSEAALTVHRNGGTQESFAEDSSIKNKDPQTQADLTITDKNVEPKQEGLTFKPAPTTDQNQDRLSTRPTIRPPQSSNEAHPEQTTFLFLNSAFTPQQQENTNKMATAEFEVKPAEVNTLNELFSVHMTTEEDHATNKLIASATTYADVEEQEAGSTIGSALFPRTSQDGRLRSSTPTPPSKPGMEDKTTFFAGRVTTEEYHAANEFIASETPYADTEQQETESTIYSVLFPHMSQDNRHWSSTPTTPFKHVVENKTTSMPEVLSSTHTETGRDAYVSATMFDKSSEHSTELSGASKPSTNIDAHGEQETVPLLSEDQHKKIATPDSVSRPSATQPQPDTTVPYDFIQRLNEKNTSDSTPNLPSYTSPVQSPSITVSAASDNISKPQYHTTSPLPELPSNSNYIHGANQTAFDTPVPADEARENTTTENLSTESQELTSHSSSSEQLRYTTTVIACTMANVEKATTTETTPEEPDGPKVVCYFPTWSFFRQGRGHYTPEDIDPRLCTHIIYGFTSLDSDPLHHSDAEKIADVKFHLRNRTLALKTVNRRLKVLLSLGGWYHGVGEDDRCWAFASNATARFRFAQHATTFVAKHRFDGLNVDWASFSGGEREDVPDKRNFVLLLQAIREAFDAYDPAWLLTAAISGNVDVIREAYDVAKIFNQTDFTSVMAYDYFGTESPVVAHYSPLQSATDETNPEKSIEYLLDVLISLEAPLEKLVLGVPFYARSYTLENPRLNYIGAPATGKGYPGPVTATPGVLAYYEICSAIKAGGWTTMMDKRAGVYAYSGDQWVCFDGPRSLTRKARFALRMGLAGLIASDVSMDDFRGECGRKSPLLNAVHRALYPEKATALAKG
ncbi:hypothetical protein HPB51_009947 [Rhipicephalus microplus]|uniref:GH18 domain-containing protein n=1 Tax=Rhipicephalus microplus TaxID=6941 RepID=A0A9J6ETK3_RHIMP|nr:cell wall protein DAN4-like [Rhipicephalus microplus]KAH8037392.1 hypothetical protein HPB51_009947 [Rhipicephalus microplus]